MNKPRPFLGIAMLCSLVGLSACGPHIPVEIGTKEVAVDIVLGEQNKAEPPLGPSNINLSPLGFPGFIEPAIPRFGTGFVPPAPPPACPVADPQAPAELVAFDSAKKPPLDAVYPYRNSGFFRTQGKGTSDYPPQITRRVHDVVPASNGDYDFMVSIGLGGTETTTSYHVTNNPDSVNRGVFMTQVVTPRENGFDSFTPSPPITLMPFPAREFGTNLEDETNSLVGRKYRSSGSDASQGTSMVLEAQVDGKSLIDACGHHLDAWDIEVTTGQIVGPGKDLQFTGHYFLATEYGALVVKDDLRFSGTDGLDSVTINNISTIDVLPKEPG
ncbi:MAG: hypothetical protein ABR507_02320 [Actinomycetota bacterium]|nr:hypothetical protein [Actinomycetota bacterium]